MKRVLIGLAGLIVLLVVALVAAPMFIPVSAYKDRIEQQGSQALGRAMTVGDDLSLSLFPRAAFHVSDLTIANAEGMSAPYLLHVGSADIGVKLLPLFGGKVEIDRFVLDRPDINLEVNAKGEQNWALGAPAPSDEAAATEESAAPTASADGLKDLKLGDVRIADGRISYQDAQSKTAYVAEKVNVGLTLDSLAEPFSAKGDAVFQGAPLTFDARVTTLDKLRRGETAAVAFNARLDQATADADLDVTGGAALTFKGTAAVDAPDLRRLADLFGAPITAETGFKNLSVSGDISGNPSAFDFQNAKVAFDDIAGTGALRVALDGPRPKATGKLDLQTLDLRPYMPPAQETQAGFPAWSDEKIDFSGLKAADVDFDLTTGAIVLPTMKIDQSALGVKITNGVLNADLRKLQLYGGSGSGALTVNARQATPQLTAKFALKALQAGPFANDAMNLNRLSGVGDLSFDLAMKGASQAAIVRSLSGKGGFALKDGAIKGVNLGKIVRSLSQLTTGLNPAALTSAVASAKEANAQTDFTSFAADFVADNGKIDAGPIALAGPYIAMDGAGVIDLPAQSIDLKLKPKVSTSAEVSAAKPTSKTRTIPLSVTGTFNAPKIGLDTQGAIRNTVEDKLRGVLTGGEKNNAEGADTEKPSLKDEALDQGLNALFGKKKKKDDTSGDDPE